jgi:ketosteroid isomerase-like protein
VTAVETLQTVYALAGQRDWKAVQDYLADDFTLYEAASVPFAGEWRGKDGMERASAAVMGTWDNPSVEILEIVGGETWAVVILNFTMTSKKTGRTFTQTVNEAAKVVDGKVTELRIHYFDTAEIAAEAG